MAGKKRSRKKKQPPVAAIVISSIFIVMVFSLVVRWAGIGRGFTRCEEPFSMEVLNGTGEQGVAGKMTKALRSAGINVLIEGNADNFNFRESLLVDRRGNPRLMKELSRKLGCRRVLRQVQEKPLVDVTFVIGWDRAELKIDIDRN